MSIQSGEQVILANEEFLAMLAHELRNPLAPIRNALHVVERNAPSSNNLVRNATEILGRQVGYIVSVIDNLLDIAKIAKHELTIIRSKVELCGLVREAVEQCRPTFNSRRHTIEVTLPDKGVYVSGDKGRLFQVLVHLLNNAAKFTETGGKVSVSMSFNDERAMINVRDTGVGIPAEAAHAVFDLFNQPDHTRHMAQGGGLGIGLHLAQQIAKLHDGDIEVYSSGLGQGTEFSVILPVIEVDEAPAQPPTSEKPKVQEKKAVHLDPNGIPIQANQAAFDSLVKFAELDGLIRKIEALANDIANIPGGERVRAHLQPKGRDGAVKYRSTDLENFKSTVKFDRPFTVCPYCAFASKAKFSAVKDCGCCKGLGWATKQSFENAPGDHKEAVEALKP